jgi:hypothetical protein
MMRAQIIFDAYKAVAGINASIDDDKGPVVLRLKSLVVEQQMELHFFEITCSCFSNCNFFTFL